MRLATAETALDRFSENSVGTRYSVHDKTYTISLLFCMKKLNFLIKPNIHSNNSLNSSISSQIKKIIFFVYLIIS